MSIDQRGRSAGAQLRMLNESVDVAAGLDQLVDRVRRRRRMQIAAASVVTVLAVAGASLSLRSTLDRAEPPPATPPTTSSDMDMYGVCQMPYLTCGAGSEMTVSMKAPMTWTIPGNFDRNLQYLSSGDSSHLWLVESYRLSPEAGGVTAAENVLTWDRVAYRDPRLAPSRSAQSAAEWLAEQPDLDSSPVTKGTVSGLPAWTVEVSLKSSHGPLTSTCTGRYDCMPLLFSGDQPNDPVLGIWEEMTSRYTFVDVPGAETAVIWSWTFGDAKSLALNDKLADSISFGPAI